jgi:hypothetical protein
LDVTAAELVIVTFLEVSADALAEDDAAAEADAAEEVFVF